MMRTSSRTTAWGFDAFADHVRDFDPAWGAAETGLEAEQIVTLARDFAATRAGHDPGRRLVDAQGRQRLAGRPCHQLSSRLDRRFRRAGRRTWAARHGAQGGGLANIAQNLERGPGDYISNQMPAIADALSAGRVKVLLLLERTFCPPLPMPGMWPRASKRPIWWSASISS